jgi:hypothetical protein
MREEDSQESVLSESECVHVVELVGVSLPNSKLYISELQGYWCCY